MSDVKVTIDEKKKVMVVEIPLQEPTASASGKSLTIASTRGGQKLATTFNGKPITLNLTAYIKP